MSANIGDRIGDYEIVGMLGAGGMGRVYKVRNVITDRAEALKVLLPDLANVSELADRFMREIKVLAGLEHPNIAGLRTAQRIDNQLVMVMELIEGVTLEDRLKTGRVPVSEALEYASQALSALSYAHARGVIHRDIKPANIMVTRDGLVKLMDFGIAKAAGDRKLTMTGTTLGSLYYMSPEQIKGSELDPRSDLYSFGVSLYELATGARPFRGDSDFSIMSAHLETQPVSPIEVDPKLHPALNEIILMAIAKDPAKRFQSASAFQAAVESVRAEFPAGPSAAVNATKRPLTAVEPVVGTPPASPVPVPPPRPASSRRGLYMAIGAVLTVAVLAIGAMQLPKWLKTRAAENPAPAEETVQQQPPAALAEQPSAQEQTMPVENAPVTPSEKTPAAPRRTGTPQTARPAQPVASQPVQGAPPAQQQAVAPSQPAQAPAAAVQADAAALKEIRKNWPMLASRAGAVSSSLQNLQQQQQRSGLGLRGDISASWKRMEHYMDQVDAALTARDAEAAKENLENAEREVALLEKFLGR
ncbi:MAG: serine/threonine protein kinase [Acidobacteriales bacterium]|nr:MAG: serine/threonine protein kinase [Terriglobales bacterium]